MKSRAAEPDKESIGYVARELFAGGVAGSVVGAGFTAQIDFVLYNQITGQDSRCAFRSRQNPFPSF